MSVNPIASKADCNKIFMAVLRSSLFEIGSDTRDIFPSPPKLKVPRKPYARQNFFRDCTKPIAKTNNGITNEKRALLAASLPTKPAIEMTEKIAPTSATIWR